MRMPLCMRECQETIALLEEPLPTYHYRCKNCGYDFTEHQSFDDAPITVCPECHEEQVRKVYSAVPIEFKGHGFYRTDGGSGSSTK
ncbi:FmdB family transcriptional regulator [Bifidobacterium goeldii]|uniref:FmdB family transcriptional regulator n=1 Tax=Bifidobacterium goeldii TaxID=2306975 RepID=A0A430FJ98_9BIFI|nr:FmdB family transcriptional regulator [Bifidobacterium goeldii]